MRIQTEPRTKPIHPKVIHAASHFLKNAVGFSTNKKDRQRGLAFVTRYLQHVFGIQEDEVAFMILDRKGKNLKFAAPEYLARMHAHFPFKPKGSLAGECLWNRSVRAINNMAVVDHLAFFETLRSDRKRADRIQKMLIYPVFIGSSPLGVVEVSRKITIEHPYRPSFSKSDAEYLDAIKLPLIRLFQSLRAAEASQLRQTG